jgi:hypothetical protein
MSFSVVVSLSHRISLCRATRFIKRGRTVRRESLVSLTVATNRLFARSGGANHGCISCSEIRNVDQLVSIDPFRNACSRVLNMDLSSL